MGLTQWFARRKNLRDFDQALAAGEFAHAVELSVADGVPPERASEAFEKLALADALRGKTGTSTFAPLLTAARDPAITSKLSSISQSMVCLAHVAAAVQGRDFDLAVRHANRMQDTEGKSVALRKIAAHLAADPVNLDRAVEVLVSIPNPQYVREDLRNLIQSRAFLSDFNSAEQLLERVTDQEKRKIFESLVSFTRAHDSLQSAEKAASFSHSDDRAFHLASVAARVGDFDRLFALLDSVGPSIRDSVRFTYACGLAYAGRFDSAVSLGACPTLGSTKISTHTFGLGSTILTRSI